MITISTKPNGSGSNWLEVGIFVEDDFGDQVWTPTQARYPHRDQELKVKREFEGRGAAQRIYWKIIVPDGYKNLIVQRWSNGDVEAIFTPERQND